MRARSISKLTNTKNPTASRRVFCVSETVVISTYGVSAHGDDFGDVFEIFVGT